MEAPRIPSTGIEMNAKDPRIHYRYMCSARHWFTESKMTRASDWLILTIAILVAVTMISSLYPLAQMNQPLQPSLGQAIVAVNNAEAAGATPNETAPLVTLLNKALELNQEASSLPTNQTEQRNATLSSVNQILTNVTNQANDLTTTSARRAYTNKIMTYVSGVVVAVVGTFAYVFGVEFYQRYRIKRTLQMRIWRRMKEDEEDLERK